MPWHYQHHDIDYHFLIEHLSSLHDQRNYLDLRQRRISFQ